MDCKEVRRILERYRSAEVDISTAIRRRDHLRNIGGSSASLEADRISQEIEKSVEFKIAVERALDRLTPVQRTIVVMKDVEKKPWVKICWKVNYSRTWCIKLHNSALRRLGGIKELDEFKSEAGDPDNL